MYHIHSVSPSMLEKKRLQVALNLKSIEKNGIFAGYASVFDVLDQHQDIVQKGAFTETLKTRGRDIKLLWQHRQDEPIGVIDEIFEDKHGLYVRGRLLLDLQRAREAYALMKEGAVSGLSIGYSPLKYAYKDDGTRMISKVELWEVSLVTFPANAAANITVVKSRDESAWLRSGELIALQDAVDRAARVLKPL